MVGMDDDIKATGDEFGFAYSVIGGWNANQHGAPPQPLTKRPIGFRKREYFIRASLVGMDHDDINPSQDIPL